MPEKKNEYIEEIVKPKRRSAFGFVGNLVRLALYGAVFGLFAAIGFSLLKPALGFLPGNRPKVVSLSENREEDGEEGTSKEEGENESRPDEGEEGEETPGRQREAQEAGDKETYEELMRSMYTVSAKAYRSIVSVTPISEESSAEAHPILDKAIRKAEGEKEKLSTGVLVADNGQELLILTDGAVCEGYTHWDIAFPDGTRHRAYMKKWDKNTNIAVLAVVKSKVGADTKAFIATAKLGNSGNVKKGDLVIALGSTFGYSDGTGYGIVSSTENKEVFYDQECKVLSTDIAAVRGETGMLFNKQGQLVGLIGGNLWKEQETATANALAISDLKRVMELLLNGRGIPYTGVYGTEVTREIGEELGIPYGIYVMRADAESPAMTAGIQSGDIIQQFNGKPVSNMINYELALSACRIDQSVPVTVKRLGADGYVDVEMELEIGEKK